MKENRYQPVMDALASAAGLNPSFVGVDVVAEGDVLHFNVLDVDESGWLLGIDPATGDWRQSRRSFRLIPL